MCKTKKTNTMPAYVDDRCVRKISNKKYVKTRAAPEEARPDVEGVEELGACRRTSPRRPLRNDTY